MHSKEISKIVCQRVGDATVIYTSSLDGSIVLTEETGGKLVVRTSITQVFGPNSKVQPWEHTIYPLHMMLACHHILSMNLINTSYQYTISPPYPPSYPPISALLPFLSRPPQQPSFHSQHLPSPPPPGATIRTRSIGPRHFSRFY